MPTCLVHNCETSRRLFYSHLLSPLSQDQIPFDPHQRHPLPHWPERTDSGTAIWSQPRIEWEKYQCLLPGEKGFWTILWLFYPWKKWESRGFFPHRSWTALGLGTNTVYRSWRKLDWNFVHQRSLGKSFGLAYCLDRVAGTGGGADTKGGATVRAGGGLVMSWVSCYSWAVRPARVVLIVCSEAFWHLVSSWRWCCR